MTQQEIFEREKENKDLIYLYREGIFWKAYEKSAFRLIQKAFHFKPTTFLWKNKKIRATLNSYLGYIGQFTSNKLIREQLNSYRICRFSYTSHSKIRSVY